MAISANRLSGDALASLVTTSFDKAKSATKQSASAAIATASKQTVLTSGINANESISPKSTAIGVVVKDNNDCKPVTKNDVNKTSNLDRSFKNTGVKCTDVRKVYDSILGKVSGFKTEISATGKKITTNISSITSKESYVYKTIKSIPFSKRLDLTSKVNNKYKKLTSNLGGTIKNKLNITSPVIKCLDSLDSYLPGENDLLKKLTLSSAIDSSGCIKPEKILAFLSELEASGIYSRMDIIDSIVSASSKTNVGSMINKLNTLKGYEATLATVKEKAEFVQKTHTSSSKIMENIKNSKLNSTTPTSDYNNIITGIAAIDPSWDKDPAGNTNYSKFRDNTTMTELSKVASPAGSSFTGIPSDSVATTVTTKTAIQIVSSRKDLEPSTNTFGSYNNLLSSSGYNNLKTTDTIV